MTNSRNAFEKKIVLFFQKNIENNELIVVDKHNKIVERYVENKLKKKQKNEIEK